MTFCSQTKIVGREEGIPWLILKAGLVQLIGIFFPSSLFLSIEYSHHPLLKRACLSSSVYLNSLLNIHSLEATSTHLRAYQSTLIKIKTEVDLFSFKEVLIPAS